jgi:DNA polymerase, archaea type
MLRLRGRTDVKVTFWLLDVNSESKEGAVELWIWGIDQAKNRVLIVDHSFQDYFYVVVKDDADPAKVADRIRREMGDAVGKLETVERRYFGVPVQAVKVYCRDKGKVAKLVRSLEGVKECLEDDIRVSIRYLIDNNVVPCSWHIVEATAEENVLQVRADKVYAANSPPVLLDKTEAPQLRTLSNYLTAYSHEGSPKPDRNPVIIISTVTGEGKEKQFSADEDKDDKQIIQEFSNYVKTYDPDLISGYGTNTKDWNYLRDRCKSLKLKLALDRACSTPHTSVYGHKSLTGIVNLDLADFADQFPEVKVKTIENLADHLGVMILENRTVVEDVDLAAYWDNPEKRATLKQFALDNAHCIKDITAALLDFAMQLSALVSLPLDHVMTAAAGFRTEWFLIKRVQKLGELIPKRIEQPYLSYAGGLVLKPKPGLHEDIAVLDFKSMYPNLMIAYNLSPDTYLLPDQKTPAGGFYEAPEVKHRFRKEPPGFYKEILTYLIGVRANIRSQMKNLGRDTVEFRVLDARQKAVKVITNAAYGYAGWIGARWYRKPVAEAASAWGRYTIQTAIQMAEKEGLQVIYGDTDSLFTTYDEKKTAALVKEIKQELGLEVETAQRYVRVFFTEAKKRYAGLFPDGSLDIVGLEVMRGDWSKVAQKVQTGVLKIILKEKSPEKAAAYVQAEIAELRQRKTPFRDLIIWKTLTKPVEAYEVNASHVEAAKALKAKGWKLAVGDKVGYVIVQGEGQLYKRVKPYIYASYGEVDVEYYVSKQVVPAAARILESFDIDEKMLLAQKGKTEKEKSLLEFAGS